MFDQNKKPTEEELGLNESKKSFSWIGIGLAVALLLTVGFQLAFPYIFKNIEVSSFLGTMIATLFMCVVAFPIGIFILSRKVKTHAEFGKRSGFAVYVTLLALTVELSITGDLVSSFLSDSQDAYSGWVFGEWYEVLLFIVVVVFISPVFEELFFRKYLVGALSTWGWTAAIIISSLFYAFFKSDILTAVFSILVGAVYAYAYLTTGKIKYPILIHIFINLFFIAIPILSEQFLASGDAIEELSSMLSSQMYSGNVSSSGIMDVLSENPGVFAAYCVNLLLGNLQLGLAVAGVVVILFFKQKYDSKPGPKKLSAKYLGDTVFMAPGIIVFILISVVLTVMQFYLS